MWKLLTALVFTVKICVADESFYTAAVVEYYPERNDSLTNEEKLATNTKNYLEYIKSASEVDIILFPESTLIPSTDIALLPLFATEVPKPYSEILCNSSDQTYKDYLKQFSCAAIEHNVTIVINTIEQENCTSNNDTGFCPASGVVFYNADIAFDENGYVSAKYHKWNLFGEAGRSPPAELEVVTLTTKNNDTFGIFTCFDILFKKPTLVLTQELGVKNILFPTMWFSELPYLTALQAQQMWAHENNVTFLSAGANNPLVGSGGTSIILGGTIPLVHEILPEAGSKLFIKSIPRNNFESDTVEKLAPEPEQDIDELARNLDNFELIVDSSIPSHTSVVLKTNETEIDEYVCNGDLVKTCCSFKINITYDPDWSKNKSYTYHLVAFNGLRSFSGTRTGAIENCGVIACLNESLSSCGHRFPNYTEIDWPVTFVNLSISGIFEQDENRIQYPNSLLASLRPISPQLVTWTKIEETDEIVNRVFSLNQPMNKILTFAIYGRDFSRDDTPMISSANGNGIIFYVVIFMQILKFLF